MDKTMKANVFNIQRNSIHDGPGIRTTVFFKGCPLRCRWCCNPESWRTESFVYSENIKCIHCGKCVAACPKGLISIIPADHQYMVKCRSKDKGRDVMQACTAGCIGCGLCAKNCPNDAIDFGYNLATINQDKCKNCGICAEKCPKKVIEKLS